MSRPTGRVTSDMQEINSPSSFPSHRPAEPRQWNREWNRKTLNHVRVAVHDRWITDWPPSIRWPHYTRANSGEVLPTPASPLGQQFTWDRGICPGWRDGYVRGGCTTLDEYTDAPPAACGF